MRAEAYAAKHGMTVEQVVEKVRSQELAGHLDTDGVWQIGSWGETQRKSIKPYEEAQGEGLLGFLGALFLFGSLFGAIAVFIMFGITAAVLTVVQGVFVFAVLRGLVGLITLAKFIAKKLDTPA